jgi:hypothetical protein
MERPPRRSAAATHGWLVYERGWLRVTEAEATAARSIADRSALDFRQKLWAAPRFADR